MAIPKQIFQTFKTAQLPWITKFHIKKMLKKNPEYEYHFYDDERVQKFFKEEFPPEYSKAYNRLTIGAAKADFFRYAILYKKPSDSNADASGWVWGYINANNTVATPASEKGSGCRGCHSQSNNIDLNLMNTYFP